jgi:integrase
MKLRRMTYVETAPDGRKIKKKLAKIYGVFVDFRGILRRLPLSEDKGAAKTLADTVDRLNSVRGGNDPVLPADLASDVENMPPTIRDRLAKWDIIRPERAAATKSLSEHLDDWKAAILADGSTADHAEKTANRARRIFDACGFKMFSDLSAHDVLIALDNMRKDKTTPAGKVKRGISPQTSNFYLQAAKQFAAWMVGNKRATQSPLAALGKKHGKLSVKTDRRHDRRAISPDELRWLLDVTEHGYSKPGPDGMPMQVAERCGMAAADRAMLYRLAAETGLRAGELRSLTRASFQFGDDPTVTIAAAYAKNRRQDTLPLRPDTAALLARHFTGKMPAAPAFNMPPDYKMIDMLRADLAAARTAWIADAQTPQDRAERDGGTFLAYVDDAGRYADFHALRHTFISNLAAGGVHPKTAQRLARHSTIALTMDRYTHLRREDLAGALDTLPDLSSTRQAAAMTGTDAVATGGENSMSPHMSPHGDFPRPDAPRSAQLAGAVVNSGSPGIMQENADFPSDSAHCGSIAQRLEQGSHKPLVPGSNPGAPMKAGVS